MRDPPDARTLLALAGQATDPLAVRCRAIAERESRNGPAPYDAVRAELAALCENGGTDPLAHLAAAIRAGRFDAPGPARARLERLLWRLAMLKLEENNPGFI
jgi:Domain of unknown function (DUF6285)